MSGMLHLAGVGKCAAARCFHWGMRVMDHSVSATIIDARGGRSTVQARKRVGGVGVPGEIEQRI